MEVNRFARTTVPQKKPTAREPSLFDPSQSFVEKRCLRDFKFDAWSEKKALPPPRLTGYMWFSGAHGTHP